MLCGLKKQYVESYRIFPKKEKWRFRKYRVIALTMATCTICPSQHLLVTFTTTTVSVSDNTWGCTGKGEGGDFFIFIYSEKVLLFISLFIPFPLHTVRIFIYLYVKISLSPHRRAMTEIYVQKTVEELKH